jgi:hypothetical protein
MDECGFDGKLGAGKLADETAKHGERIKKARIVDVLADVDTFTPQELEVLGKCGITGLAGGEA